MDTSAAKWRHGADRIRTESIDRHARSRTLYVQLYNTAAGHRRLHGDTRLLCFGRSPSRQSYDQVTDVERRIGEPSGGSTIGVCLSVGAGVCEHSNLNDNWLWALTTDVNWWLHRRLTRNGFDQSLFRAHKMYTHPHLFRIVRRLRKFRAN